MELNCLPPKHTSPSNLDSQTHSVFIILSCFFFAVSGRSCLLSVGFHASDFLMSTTVREALLHFAHKHRRKCPDQESTSFTTNYSFVTGA